LQIEIERDSSRHIRTHAHAQASSSRSPVAGRGANGKELSPKRSVLDHARTSTTDQ